VSPFSNRGLDESMPETEGKVKGFRETRGQKACVCTMKRPRKKNEPSGNRGFLERSRVCNGGGVIQSRLEAPSENSQTTTNGVVLRRVGGEKTKAGIQT